MALKIFREDGFDAVLYESRDWVGGLWKVSTDNGLSAAENTIFNTSKYRAAATDFPMPDDFDDFPTSAQLYKYWNDYCDHFQLWPHINLKTKVSAVRREEDRWAVVIFDPGKDSDDAATHAEYFDKVCVATGPFAKPKFPKLEGIEKFAGSTTHVVNHHDPSQYAGKTVLLVGLHASACDAACGLASHAKKVWISHRSGVVFTPRYTSDGAPFDKLPPFWFILFSLYLSAWFPAAFFWILDQLLVGMSKKAYPNVPESWGVSKARSIAVTTPLIVEELYPHLSAGTCEPVASVARITGPKTVELTSGQVLPDIDAIIYCTGYHFYIPLSFSPPDLNPYPTLGQPANLYRNIFPLHPDLKIRASLAFQGQAAIPYPGFSQFEVQILSISQIWLGNSSLPTHATMLHWHATFLAWRNHLIKKYNARETFYTAILPFSDMADWYDKTAGLGMRQHFGYISRWTSPTALKFWWREPELYRACLNDFSSPAMFRLFETGKRRRWEGAREAIWRENGRIEESQRARLRGWEKEGGGETWGRVRRG